MENTPQRHVDKKQQVFAILLHLFRLVPKPLTIQDESQIQCVNHLLDGGTLIIFVYIYISPVTRMYETVISLA